MRFLFKRASRKSTSDAEILQCHFDIQSNVSPAPSGYDQLSENELRFFSAFEQSLISEKLSPYDIKLTRLSSGMFNVNCRAGYIGKIRIPSKPSANFYIQYLGPRGSIKEINSKALDSCIECIPFWIQTVKRYSSSRKRALQ